MLHNERRKLYSPAQNIFKSSEGERQKLMTKCRMKRASFFPYYSPEPLSPKVWCIRNYWTLLSICLQFAVGLLQYGVPSWVSTMFWIWTRALETEQGMNHGRCLWIHGPYSWREKARLWSQMNFSCKILVPPFFQLGDLQRVIRFSLNFLFSYL